MGDVRAYAYVSHGVWVAGCPRLWCVHADHFGPGPLTGRIGGLTRDSFSCLYCGLQCASIWPDNAEDIWRVLQARPQPETRNWWPGEELDALVVDNLMHGLVDPDSLRDRKEKAVAYNGRLTETGRAVAPAPHLILSQIGR